MRCRRANKTEVRVAEFVLGLLRDPEILREEAECQAEGERRGLESSMLGRIYGPDDA